MDVSMLRTSTLLVAALAAPQALRADDLVLFTLGSGDVTGSYYASATALCDSVNRAEVGKLRCSPDPTVGSVYNIEALRRGELDFAIVQSDTQLAAYLGTGVYADVGGMEEMRSVMGLYSESMTVLVGRDTGIETLADLRGRRVDIGLASSGRRATVDRMLTTLEIAPSDFASIAELPQGVALDELCEGTIDATALVVGHPNATVGRVLRDCGARIVALSADDILRLTSGSSDIHAEQIPAFAYPEESRDIQTIGVTATIVTRADVDPDVISVFVSDVIGDLAAVAQHAPVLRGLDADTMRAAGLTAPLHPAAEAAFTNRSP
jgi:uncharacterized protein